MAYIQGGRTKGRSLVVAVVVVVVVAVVLCAESILFPEMSLDSFSDSRSRH